MINALTRAAKLGTLLAVTIFATAAGAQAPSQAQRDAIKSQCRGDYMAHCSSVPPGGAESLQCLQKNMSSLSAGCAGAVKAVQPPAAPKAETAPAPAPAKESAPTAARTEPAPAATTTAKPAAPTAAPKAAATAAPAQQPSSAQISAIRSACRSDYPKVCAGVPTGGAPALQCLDTEQVKALGRLWTGGQRGNRRHCRAGGKWRNRRGAGGHRNGGGARRDRAAADAAARGVVGGTLGLRCRCPLAVRHRCGRRRPHRAMPGKQRCLAVARLQGRADAIRRAIASRPREASRDAATRRACRQHRTLQAA